MHSQINTRSDRVLFVSASLYNISAALIPLLAPDFYFRIFFAPTPVPAGPILYMITRAFWVFVLIFGIGYLWAARDPERNHAVLWLGALAKIYLFFTWTIGYFLGITSIIGVLGFTGDLIFAILFIRFLLREEQFVRITRTNEERFNDLPDFPFRPNYIDVFGARIHYLDEGKGNLILCLHGEPSWSFIYRKMIPILARNHRVIVPDFIGFGRSDKFTRRSDYTFAMHRDTLREFIRRLDISDATMVVQDWGGPVGLRVLSMEPDLFTHLVVLNTSIPTAEEPPSFAAALWRFCAQLDFVLLIGLIMRMGTARHLPRDVVRAYKAPFSTDVHKRGAWVFPLMYPLKTTDAVAKEMKETRLALSEWRKPAAVIFSDRDPIHGNQYQFFRDLIPTANGPQSAVITGAGHFLQEDKGEEIAERILEFLRQPAS